MDTVDDTETSIKPLLFIDGYENAVVEGVKTGEKACVKVCFLAIRRVLNVSV